MNAVTHTGDCLSILPTIPDNSIDLILTSPPYNKNGLQGKTKPSNQVWSKFNIDYNNYGDDLPEDDYQQWMKDFLLECFRLIKPTGSILFNHKPRRHKNRCFLPTDFLPPIPLYQLIIWDRRNSPNIRNDILVPSTEHIYWFCKNKPNVFRDKVQHKGEVWTISAPKQKDHPAPFPEELVENGVLLTTQPNDVVLDPFMGSGTTGVVCKKLGRNFIGIEQSPDYVEISRMRLENTTV